MDNLLFHHLAPTSEANIDCYKEALDYVFEHPEIKNIAITGTYGSGKSSKQFFTLPGKQKFTWWVTGAAEPQG